MMSVFPFWAAMLNQLSNSAKLYVPSEGFSRDHCVSVSHRRIAPNGNDGHGTLSLRTSGCKARPNNVPGTTALTGTHPVPDNVSRCGESAASLITIMPPVLAVPDSGS